MSERMMICPKCKRSKVEKCSYCNGTCRDPRNPGRECGVCRGIGYVKCRTCGGRGEVTIPEFNRLTY